jgi:O-antigen ligase
MPLSEASICSHCAGRRTGEKAQSHQPKLPMRYLLILPICIYTLQDSFDLPLSFGLGLSLKNAVLYVVALMLALRMATRGGYKFELPGIQASFAILIGYAVSSMLVADLVIHYPGYQLVESIARLKMRLVDNAVILGLFFYGTRTIKDGVFLTKVLVAAVTLANIVSIASIGGYLGISGVAGTGNGAAGRAIGAFGQPNETAALIVLMIPAYVAIARSSGGAWPLIWILGAMGSVALLLMAASRGAFFAMLIAYPWAAYVFRRYVSWRQVLLWAGALIPLGAVILSLTGTHFVSVFLERVITESGASDVGSLSSGRTDIWARGIGKMMAMPLTLITGFGWNAWDTMGFYFSAHNEYLLTWFELGLVGLCSYLFLLLRTLSTARSAVDSASPLARGYLMAFVAGFGAFLIAMFFAEIFDPWPYFWVYAALSLRMALISLQPDVSAPEIAASGDERRDGPRSRAVVTRSSRLPEPTVNAPSTRRRQNPFR